MENQAIIKQAEKILGKRLGCRVPFEHLMLFPNGVVCSCCPALVNTYTFGNILADSFEEIWNGEKAKRFRKSIIDGTFEFCNLKSCLTLSSIKDDARYNYDLNEYNELEAKMPIQVHFNIDTTCNARCIMCRDEKICQADYVKKYAEITEPVLIPLLENTEFIYLNGSGEIFASSLCRQLVKKITAKYPNINFNLITNGILASEQNFDELGLDGKIRTIEVSMHAIKKETYEKIVRDGDFNKVIENLKYLSMLKRTGKIKVFVLNFIVNSINYREMIEFQEFANSIGADTHFWEYRKWGSKLDERYEEVAVFEPLHPEHDEFLKIVKNKIFDNSTVVMNAKLRPFEV